MTEKPPFKPVNDVVSDKRHAKSDNELEAIYPSPVRDQIADAVEGIDFRSSLSALNSLAEIKKRLVHRAASAYPQDMLEGRTANNADGLANYLGYDPKVDISIGYMVPKPDGNDLFRTVLIAPIFHASSEDSYGHWEVDDVLTKERPMGLRSPFVEKVSFNAAGSAGLTTEFVEFATFEEAMRTIHQDLVACGYEILEPEPRTSSVFNADLASPPSI